MASQPKRSAFALTATQYSIFHNIHVILRILLLITTIIIVVRCDDGSYLKNSANIYVDGSDGSSESININNNHKNFLTLVSNSGNSVNNNNHNDNNYNYYINNSFSNNQSGNINNNNTSNIQPKFGDRLLPRHRQFGSSLSGSSNINQTSISLNTNTNNNNNNFSFNYNGSSSAHTSSNINIISNVQSLVTQTNNNHDRIIINNHDDHYQKINTDHNTSINTNNNQSDSVNHSHKNHNTNNNNNNEDHQHHHGQNDDDDDDRLKSSSIRNGDHQTRNSSGHKKDNDHENLLWWLHNNNHHLENPEIDAVVRNVAAPVIIDDDDDNEQQKNLPSSSSSSSSVNIANALRRRNDYDIERNVILENGNLTKADRLIEMSTEFFIVPSSTTVNPSHEQQNYRNYYDQQQGNSRIAITPRPVLILAPRTPSYGNMSLVTPPSITAIHHLDGLRKEPWVVPVLVLASLSMIMMAAFEIFVLFKAWKTSPSRRHLFLGQMLLLGLFACAAFGAVLTATPTIIACATIRFGVGVAYALVFSALLVKCVFLISLNGGVYLPAPYQGLLLLFAVLIQVAIGAQWLMTQPPDIHTLTVPITSNIGTTKFSMLITSTDITRGHSNGTQMISLCKTQFSEFLLSLIYIVFLIIFVTVLAIKSRGIRDNYREATYIGLAIGGSIPIWLGWTLCGLAVADRHKDACLAFGLVATSATIFLVMFMPKGRQLAAMGKEGLYVEDREEEFSSLSRAGSGYSPSFFHFKPIKYGVMGHIPNSATNTTCIGGGNGLTSTTCNTTKHPNGATLGGDRVALVPAGPPSYTRMYHYFPAHLTHPFCFYPPPPLSPPLSPLKAIGSHTPTSAQFAHTIRYPGLFMRPDETNLYTTLEPTMSSNPNVYFQRSGGVHPGMMY